MTDAPDHVRALVDFERYPVHDPDGRGASLAAACREELLATGSCLLEGFLTAPAVERIARESATLVPLAHRETGGRRGTAYLAPPDESFPERHPKRRLQTTSVGAVAYDLIPPSHGLRQIYEWDGL